MTTDCRLQTTYYRLQTSDYRLQTTDYRLQFTDYRLLTIDYRLQRTGAGAGVYKVSHNMIKLVLFLSVRLAGVQNKTTADYRRLQTTDHKPQITDD